MHKLAGSLVLGSALWLLSPSVLHAGSRGWLVCGGSTFATCASVYVTVDASNHVTMRVWNLSGNSGTAAKTIFAGIGFENVGTADAVAGSLTMSGPKRDPDAPVWLLHNDQGIGGGINLDLVATAPNGLEGGIASQCAAGTLPTGNTHLWWNPCTPSGGPADPGWVVIEFDIVGHWNLNDSYLLVKGQQGSLTTKCVTGGPNANCNVVPEPLSMTLLATGLAGLGAARAARRRGKVAGPEA